MLLRVYRVLALEHGVDPKRLEGVNAHKLDTAIRPGVEHIEAVLEDCCTLTPKELAVKYRSTQPPAPECPTCGRQMPRRRRATQVA